jgi:prophage tail gpP-like protein
MTDLPSMRSGGVTVATGGAAGATAAKPPSNKVTLIAGGQALTGWQSIRVTRSLDRVPGDFEIALTEKYPGQAAAVVVNPGDPCALMLGSDSVITGFVDRYNPSFSPRGHQVRIFGRSKCEDIVDCSISPSALNGMSMTTTSLQLLAQQLASPYGITVSSLTGNSIPVSAIGGGPLTFSAILTETPYEIIERVARYAGVLAYDGTDGNLILANVGTSTMATGFQQGQNVEAADVSFSMDQRFQEYLPVLMSSNMFGSQGQGGVTYAPAFDKGVKRFRQLIVVSEQFAISQQFAQQRIQWEMARRAGRSQAVRLVCDSWRDQAGTLWTPNAFAPINLPALKLTPKVPWIIGEVTFHRDEDGTHAELLLMPKEAFTPEPTILTPFFWDPTNGPPPTGGGGAALPNASGQ